MAPSQHDRKIVYRDVKQESKQKQILGDGFEQPCSRVVAHNCLDHHTTVGLTLARVTCEAYQDLLEVCQFVSLGSPT